MGSMEASRDDMRRYEVVVVDHSGAESEFVAMTSGGPAKAAYMAGSAFSAKHPRAGIARFCIVEAGGKRRDGDLIDRMEW